MPILSTLLVIALVGVVCWALVTYVPMPPAFKTLIIAVAIIGLVIWILNGIGALGSINVPVRIR